MAEPLNSKRSGASRRVLAGMPNEPAWRRWMDGALAPRFGVGILIAIVFAFCASLVVLWARGQTFVEVGRVMDQTRLVRVQIQLPDRQQTEQRRTAARQSTPRVYNAIEPEFEAIGSSLEGLPRALAGVASLAEVEAGIRDQFGLDDDSLAAIKAEAGANGEPSRAWTQKVKAFMGALRRRPMLDNDTFQRGQSEGTHSMVRLVFPGSESLQVRRSELLNADAKDPDSLRNLTSAIMIEARDAGFDQALRNVVVHRLTHNPRAMFTFDPAATARDQNTAAEQVELAKRTSPPGQVIFQRGDRLTQEQLDLYKAEAAEFNRLVEPWRQWMQYGALVLAVSAITAALAGYTILFCPRVRRRGSRILGVAGILLATLIAACAGTAAFPGAAILTSVMPTVLVALLISIGYDRRAALAYALLHGLLVCVALRSTIGTMAIMTSGIACVVIMARDLRDRNAFVRLAIVTAFGVALGTLAFGIIERPVLSEGLGDTLREAGGKLRIGDDTGLRVIQEILVDAGLAAIGVLVVGSTTLFVLPWLERAFDVATGMTLIELRDPKQPLLRELQMRAPGTYTHSLNVATIAENAADAIGADGLLTYVGALYHDIGKMTKPEYFVENQSGGPNKHDKLSPAMSLLVVVGHVKEGMELAREHALPKVVRHFIESHHGTTLVEYFYHRARQQAERASEEHEDDGTQMPDEFEYRYPGPRPRTKEAAVLMISDASESAARALGEPTPARIDQLVRTIANKRLLDGQFDDCEMTLRELSAIVESITRTLTGIYHGRIQYPSAEPKTQMGQVAEVEPRIIEEKRAL